ncbi:hypothetical protein GGR57DRAFT_507593 [Xylariaceae sp. FL1272]|nr:hypothetical protein GGR57DRAFT_507593 [Xylariaceae sp. FL1272]
MDKIRRDIFYLRLWADRIGARRKFIAASVLGEQLVFFMTLQRRISHYNEGFERGDEDLRSQFQYIRAWYQRFLFANKPKLKPEFLDDVDLWDLEGYTLLPISRITRKTKIDNASRIRRQTERRQRAKVIAAQKRAEARARNQTALSKTKQMCLDTVKQLIAVPPSRDEQHHIMPPELRNLLNKLRFPIPTVKPNYAVVLSNSEYEEAKVITAHSMNCLPLKTQPFSDGEEEWLDDTSREYPYYTNWQVQGLKLGRLTECALLEEFEEASELCVAMQRKMVKWADEDESSTEAEGELIERRPRRKLPSPLRNVWNAE